MELAWQDLFTAIALMLVIEGMMPFVNPAGWRRALAAVLAAPDRTLRAMGLTVMLIGLALLAFVR